jgi:serine/threonine protein kinase/tetratricopeptide (TPR) repeat protein
VLRKLGQGGMGVVYAARDERLQRDVAVKTMSALAPDETTRKRFWREARAAASVNHPNICQLYEVGEHRGEPFIAMELLEGEPLSERVKRGAASVSESLPIGLQMLAALGALHDRGVIHRDLKPSNVFVTPHGVKLLDFGLARAFDPDSADGLTDLTLTGMVVGTPGYMAPERVNGEPADARSDLFAVGAIMFELLAGRPPFAGRTVAAVFHATLHEQPPALSGSPAIAALDRVIRRALAKNPADRPPTAAAMAAELRAVPGGDATGARVLARALPRIVVLPFRILRSDPETDFLSFSLADAIATSLSSLGSLLVRSSATAARLAGAEPDLKVLAAEASVDRVVLGTLLRSGDELRATSQLVEAPGGEILASHTVQASLGDLFALQDDIARRVVEALALPLTGDRAAAPDAEAYRLYLRANELARSYDGLPEARELYRRCLETDPGFAPAWARLGRCHWVIGKYIEDSDDAAGQAAAALSRALALDARLAVAHKLYASLEADCGRTLEALTRLLDAARDHGDDPELLAGLVHVCRYCGLNEQSLAGHEEARRLDPNVPTSFGQTLVMMGDYERVFAIRGPGPGADDALRAVGLGLAGRRDEARKAVLDLRSASRLPVFGVWADFLDAWLDRRPAAMLEIVTSVRHLKITEDPESRFQTGWLLCDAGGHEQGLAYLGLAVANGYYPAPTLAASASFARLRSAPAFQALLAEAEAGRRRALAVFHERGGAQLLG